MSALAFILGVYLCIRVIAALYGILDLWFSIGTEYPRVIGAILGWGVATAASAWTLPRPAFLWGFGGYLVFYCSLYVLRHPALRLMRDARD